MPGYIWIGLTTLTLHAIQLPKPSLKVAWKKNDVIDLGWVPGELF